MKKTLVAIAALAAFGAQAQSSVEAFGIVDIGYGIQKDEAGTGALVRETKGVKDGALAGNRLGFRGTEDLGGGSAAVFWLESGISPSTGSLLNERDGASGHVAVARTTATTRQAYAGWKNAKAGEVRIGFQNSLNYDLTSQRHALSIYPETRGGEAHNYISPAARNTAVTYFSPKIANIEFSAQWASGADHGLTSKDAYALSAGSSTTEYKANIYALGAIYKNGPLQAGLVTTQVKVQGASPVATSQYVTATSNAAVTNLNERLTASTMLAARYNFGSFELAANYGKGSIEGTTTALAGKADREQVELGIKVPVGATDLIASYGTGKNKGATTAAGKADIEYYGVGAIQNLSKRTRLYALYGYQNDKNLTTATDAAKLTGTRIGISHAF